MTNIVMTIDGPQITETLTDNCCPPMLYNIDYCSFICGFMDYLPKGPLWDVWKEYRKSQMISYGTDACSLYSQCDDDEPCLTIVDHAIYTAKKLLYILQNPLQTAIWESSPLTAYFTRSKYIKESGYVDCFEGPAANASLGFPSPYQAVCNPNLPQVPCVYEPVTMFQMSPSVHDADPNPVINIETQVKAACPSDLNDAVQYGILLALQRINLGVVRNLDGLNFILAPLGAQISMTIPDYNYNGPECVMVNDCNQMTGTKNCSPYRPLTEITLTNSALTLPAGPGITEPLRAETFNAPKTTINAYYYFPGIEMPVTTDCPEGTIAGNGYIWPALMAAQCILVALLPSNLNYTLTRTPTVIG